MTDRELLEAAAKAIGKNPLWHEWDMTPDIWGIRTDDPDGGIWNPLTDDGDALRLLVELSKRDMVRMELGRTGASVEFDSSPMFGQVLGNDLNDCARRAIVRAAAEIGKAQP